jgi:parvulin-like peptidyl-prolyl isomerase
MCRRAMRLSMYLVAGLAVVGVVACGGSSGGGVRSPASTVPAPESVGKSSRVVVRVGAAAITAGMVDRWLEIEEHNEDLAPPHFAACVTKLQAASSAPGAPQVIPGVAKPSAAQLQGVCKAADQQLREEALTRYILGDWVFGAARELGVDISGQAFDRTFSGIIKKSFPTQARFQHYMRSVGRTEADEMFQVHRDLDTEAIRATVERRAGPVTNARVKEYYEHNKSKYYFQQTRNLEIVATPTKAAAMAARKKIVAGESFAAVVKGESYPQAILSSHGLVEGLPRGYYKEPSLDNAIFTARPGVLSAPIKTVIGYFVFELKKVNPAYQEPFAQVAASISQTLPKQLKELALSEYIRRWRARWTARTNCSPGYVVPKCRQYRVSPSAQSENPYTFN